VGQIDGGGGAGGSGDSKFSEIAGGLSVIDKWILKTHIEDVARRGAALRGTFIWLQKKGLVHI